jgi:hypothetical protein
MVDEDEQMVEISNRLVCIRRVIQVWFRMGDLLSAKFGSDGRTSSNMLPNNMVNLVSFFTSSSNFLIAGCIDLGCLSTCSIVSFRNLW